jgi:hypothetical protein
VEYLDIQWHHNNVEYPIRLVSEIDAERFEVRKLEFFSDGRVGHACGTSESLGTMLGECPDPSLAEITADPQFTGKQISAEEFESLWATHALEHP